MPDAETSLRSPDGGTPDGALLNQIVIDPRDAKLMYIATSIGGVFDSRDCAQSWRPQNKDFRMGFMPDLYPQFGQDAHDIQLSPAAPDRPWHQNRSGICCQHRGFPKKQGWFTVKRQAYPGIRFRFIDEQNRIREPMRHAGLR